MSRICKRESRNLQTNDRYAENGNVLCTRPIIIAVNWEATREYIDVRRGVIQTVDCPPQSIEGIIIFRYFLHLRRNLQITKILCQN